MEILTKTDLQRIFFDKKVDITFYLDKKSNLFWSDALDHNIPLSELPWKYQKFFYFRFLRDDTLAERFKDMEIIGAIDLFIKYVYCERGSLELHR